VETRIIHLYQGSAEAIYPVSENNKPYGLCQYLRSRMVWDAEVDAMPVA